MFQRVKSVSEGREVFWWQINTVIKREIGSSDSGTPGEKMLSAAVWLIWMTAIERVPLHSTLPTPHTPPLCLCLPLRLFYKWCNVSVTHCPDAVVPLPGRFEHIGRISISEPIHLLMTDRDDCFSIPWPIRAPRTVKPCKKPVLDLPSVFSKLHTNPPPGSLCCVLISREWVFWRRCFLFCFVFLKSQTIFVVFPIMLFSLKRCCDEKNKKRECWEENRVVSHTAVWLRARSQREVFASCMLYVRWGNLLLTYTWHPVSISVRAWNPGHETGDYVSLWYCCVPVMLNFQWQGCGLLLTLATFKKDIRKTSAAFLHQYCH